MALETGTYISDLVATNPTSGDPKSQGDDHLRLLKSTIKATFPNVNGAVSATDEQLNAPTAGTVTATTSGTSIDYTSIPSWVKRITISLAGVSTSGTSNPLVQIGDSGGVETSGYLGASVGGTNGASPGVSNYTTGFGINSALGANVLHGSVVLTLLNAATNTWVASGNLMLSSSGAFIATAGSKSLSGTLDRVRLTTVGGSDTFDAGSMNILYE